jgi:ketosteroid isomerase-like protein
MSNEDPFPRLLALYQSAVLAKDTEAFLALYEPDLHVFDMWGIWSLRGIGSWRAMADDWFSSLGTEKVVVTADEVESTTAGELAIGHAILTFTAISAEGERVRSLTNRLTMGLRLVGGSWKVFHEHTSAPIDHQSIKAVLHRADMPVIID